MSKHYNYTYEIKGVDVQTGHLIIKWTPEDANLSPFELNTRLVYKQPSQILDANNNPVYATIEDIPFDVHLDYTVRTVAPHHEWHLQELLVNNVSGLVGTSGTVTDPEVV